MEKEILIIDQYNKIGGGQSVLIDLINSINTLKLKCKVVVPRGGHIETHVSNADFYYLRDLNLTPSKKNILDIFKLLFHYIHSLSIIKHVKKADIVYVNGPRYFLFFYLISFFSNCVFIYHVHLDFPRWGKLVIYLLARNKKTYAIVFTSHYLLSECLKQIKPFKKYSLSKCRVIEPGLAPQYRSQVFVNRFEIPLTNLNFVSIGRVYPEKGFDTIIDIANIYNNYNFYIIGAPELSSVEYFNHLKERAGENVFFLGSSDAIPELMDSLNINFGIVPSNVNEAFGIVAIELMICSCITFVRNKGGLNDIALKTKAIIFEDNADLKKQIDKVIGMNIEDIHNLNLIQYENAKSIYGKDAFTLKIAELLSPVINNN